MNETRVPWGTYIAVVLFAVVAFFLQLGKDPIGNSDEGIHALVTREMRESGDWLTLRFQGEYYFRKPPLSFWIRGVTQQVLGENEFTDRLPSALAGVGTAVIVAAWAWRWTRKRAAMLVAAAVLVLIPSTFTHTFRTGESDGLLIFFSTLTAFFLWLSLEKPRYVIAAGATAGLALMTKSVAAAAVPLLFAVTLVVLRRWPYRVQHLLAALVVFIALAAPWHIYQWKTHGSEFWGEYIGYHVVERVETKLHVTPQLHGPFWYIRGVTQGMFPWSFLIVPASAFSVYRMLRRRSEDRAPDAFLLSWAFGTVVLFSIAATKLAWYVAPAFPAFALLVARFTTAPFLRLPRWLQLTAATSVIAGLLDTFRQYRTGISRFFTLSFLKPEIAVLLVVVAVAVVLLIAYRRSRESGERVLGAASTLAFAFFMLVSAVVYSRYLRLDHESPFRVFRNEIVARNPSARVYIFDNGIYPSPLTTIYLAGERRQREVVALKKNDAALDKVITEQRGAFIIFNRDRALSDTVTSRAARVREYSSQVLYEVK